MAASVRAIGDHTDYIFGGAGAHSSWTTIHCAIHMIRTFFS